MHTPADFVFVGDSITDAGRDRADPASLGDGYVSLLAPRLAPASVRNAGIAGDRAADLALRWDRDVLALSPEVLSLYVGVNDTWRRFDSGQETSAAVFAATCRRLLASTSARTVVIMEPFLLPVRPEQELWLDDLAGKRESLRALADEIGAVFVPLHGILTAAAAEVAAGALAPDGVHPTSAGSLLIAEAWERATGDVTIH